MNNYLNNNAKYQEHNPPPRSNEKVIRRTQQRKINANMMLWSNNMLSPNKIGRWIIQHCHPGYVKEMIFRTKRKR